MHQFLSLLAFVSAAVAVTSEAGLLRMATTISNYRLSVSEGTYEYDPALSEPAELDLCFLFLWLCAIGVVCFFALAIVLAAIA